MTDFFCEFHQVLESVLIHNFEIVFDLSPTRLFGARVIFYGRMNPKHYLEVPMALFYPLHFENDRLFCEFHQVLESALIHNFEIVFDLPPTRLFGALVIFYGRMNPKHYLEVPMALFYPLHFENDRFFCEFHQILESVLIHNFEIVFDLSPTRLFGALVIFYGRMNPKHYLEVPMALFYPLHFENDRFFCEFHQVLESVLIHNFEIVFHLPPTRLFGALVIFYGRMNPKHYLEVPMALFYPLHFENDRFFLRVSSSP